MNFSVVLLFMWNKKIVVGFLFSLVLSAITFIAPPVLPARADSDQLIAQQLSVAYFDIWQDVDGNWDDSNRDGKPDVINYANTAQTNTINIPSGLADKYTITRCEVVGGSGQEPTEVQFNDPLTSGWAKDGGIYHDYYDKYLKHLSSDYHQTYQLAGDKTSVIVKWKLLLGPKISAFPLTKPGMYKDTIGLRWYLPSLVKWYGIPKTELNLVATNISSGADSTAQPNKSYTGSVTFQYNGTTPATSVPIGVFDGTTALTLKDSSGKVVSTADFNSGEKKTFTYTWTAPSSGTVTLTGVIDTSPLANKYTESNENDNKVSVSVPVQAILAPSDSAGSVDGNLTLSAVSQDKKTTRPAGTVKWTDWITANLTMDRPIAPHDGILHWWQVTDAKIIYPMKNPKFTFGNPLEPIGTTPMEMLYSSSKMMPDTSTASATQTFQEQWSMDGAKIYNIPKHCLMAETPKTYPIDAQFTVFFEYEYTVTDSDGSSETIITTGTQTKTINGSILVNGTGVNSRAQ